MKIYDNPNNLPSWIIKARLLPLDGNVSALAYETNKLDANLVSVGITYYVSIESILSDAQIDAALLDPLTASELAEVNDLPISRQQIKNAYENMIIRLGQIQNAGVIPFTQAGFSQVVQAVKDEALYIERILRVLKRIV